MRKKIVAFVGETYHSLGGQYCAMPTSAAFLQDVVGCNNVFVASGVFLHTSSLPSSRFSTFVNPDNFYIFPHYSSTKDFVLKTVTKKGFLRQFIARADEVIKVNYGSWFWIRTPSIGSIVFGLRVLKHNQKLLHHMCASASNTWRDKKYSNVERFFGFVVSRILVFLLKRICQHPNTLNLCTGDELEKFSSRYSPLRTKQFVDVMVKVPGEIAKIKGKDVFKTLFVGRVVADKGIFTLLSAMVHLPSSIVLTVIGDGADLEAARDYVKSNALEHRVIFLGQLANEEISREYLTADLVVVPSNNYYEGFPRVIMEAWAYHLPVIVSNVGGINAFVQQEKNGLIVAPGNLDELTNAIMRCFTEEHLLLELTEGAKKMARQSTQEFWAKNLKKWLEDEA